MANYLSMSTLQQPWKDVRTLYIVEIALNRRQEYPQTFAVEMWPLEKVKRSR